VLSSLFSFNHQHGACPQCHGLGEITLCDPAKLITHPDRSLLAGAMDGTKTGRFYGEPDGQYIAILKTVGDKHDLDFTPPWNDLDPATRMIALFGTGEEEFDVIWPV